jgi:ABC-type branched-subunit amino acid transport system substrate-binding protein
MNSLARFIFCCFVINSSVTWADTPTSSSIKVGVVQSLTGIAAEDGKTVVQALKLAADDFNSRSDSKVELLIEDDGSQPKNSVSALTSLVRRKVQVIIGATWDFTTNAILPAASTNNIVIFNTSTLPESLVLPQSKRFAFINSIRAEDEAAVFHEFLQKRRPSGLAIVFANNSWGETQSRAYKKIAGSLKVPVVDELRSSSYDSNEWSTFVSRLKQKRADVVVLLLNKSDLELFLRRARELGLRSSFFASKNLFDALRVSTTKDSFNDVCFTYPFEQLARESEFRARYKQTFGEDARIYADNSYDALFIIAKAAEHALKTGVALHDSLRTVQHDGLVGRYAFSEERSFSIGRSSLVCVRRGEPHLERSN